MSIPPDIVIFELFMVAFVSFILRELLSNSKLTIILLIFNFEIDSSSEPFLIVIEPFDVNFLKSVLIEAFAFKIPFIFIDSRVVLL